MQLLIIEGGVSWQRMLPEEVEGVRFRGGPCESEEDSHRPDVVKLNNGSIVGPDALSNGKININGCLSGKNGFVKRVSFFLF